MKSRSWDKWVADQAWPCSHCKDYDFTLSHTVTPWRVCLELPFSSYKQLPGVAILSLTGQLGAFTVNLPAHDFLKL